MTMTTLADLPNEMIEEILSFLSGDEVFLVMNTNRTFRHVAQRSHFWKDICQSEWKSLTNVEPIDELENPLTVDWYEVYLDRAQEYSKWTHRFQVRRWLITDYLRMMWWIFISPHGQPLYIKAEQSENLQKRAIQSGVILTDFFVFIPLLFCALIFKWWGFLFIPFILAAFVSTLVVDKIDLDTGIGKALMGCITVFGILSLILSYFNDLWMIIGMLFSLTLALAMAHSMRDIIINSNIGHFDSSNLSVISVMVLSILCGALVGIAGVRILVVILIFIVIIGGGNVGGDLLSLVGIKGLIMVATCIICVGLYYLGVKNMGREEGKSTIKKIISILILLSILVLNLGMMSRWIMVIFFNFPILNIPDFEGFGRPRNSTQSLMDLSQAT